MQLLMVITLSGGKHEAAYVGTDAEAASAAWDKARSDAKNDAVARYDFPSPRLTAWPACEALALAGLKREAAERLEREASQRKAEAAEKLEAARKSLAEAEAHAAQHGVSIAIAPAPETEPAPEKTERTEKKKRNS